MKKIFTIIVIVILVIAGLVIFSGISKNGPSDRSGATYKALKEISKYKYTDTYADTVYGFSFRHPDDFEVTAVPDENGEAILIENLSKKIGVQIILSPFESKEENLTAEIVKMGVPDMRVSDAKEIVIGGFGARKALAFESDNESFGGKSSEIWFVANGYLYQMSTYAELEDFLSGLFATWKFI